MTLSAELVCAFANRLRYLITSDDGPGVTLEIPTTGGATADLLTDSVQGPIKKLAKVVSDGFASFAAGVQTQAKARALWLSDWSGADPAPGDPAGKNSLVTTAISRITPREGEIEWSVDADVDGDGNPLLLIGASTDAAGCTDITYTFSVVLIVGTESNLGINAEDCAITVTIEQAEDGTQILWGDVKAELDAAGFPPGGTLPADGLAIPAPPSTAEEAWVFEGVAECIDGEASINWDEIVNIQGAEPPADMEQWLFDSAGSFFRTCELGVAGSCYLDVFVPEAIG